MLNLLILHQAQTYDKLELSKVLKIKIYIKDLYIYIFCYTTEEDAKLCDTNVKLMFFF